MRSPYCLYVCESPILTFERLNNIVYFRKKHISLQGHVSVTDESGADFDGDRSSSFNIVT
jgi:hypothetical protein